MFIDQLRTRFSISMSEASLFDEEEVTNLRLLGFKWIESSEICLGTLLKKGSVGHISYNNGDRIQNGNVKMKNRIDSWYQRHLSKCFVLFVWTFVWSLLYMKILPTLSFCAYGLVGALSTIIIYNAWYPCTVINIRAI